MATVVENSNIYTALEAVRIANNGKTYLAEGAVYGTRRDALINLLRAHGVNDVHTHSKVTAKDLAILYASTRKDDRTGSVVAKRIEAKYFHNPLLDAPLPTPPAPPVEAPPAPAPPVEAPATTSIDAEAVRALIQEEIADLRDDTTVAIIRGLGAAVDSVGGRVEAMVAQALKAQTPTHLTVTMPDAPPVALGLVHERMPDILKALNAGVNLYLHGPAGSGKTTAARMAAVAFGLPFYFAAKVESEYLLLGFKDARGETVRTQFREAYEHGGLFLFDELDASSPSAVVALNAALANGVCPFPDGTIARHASFKCIAGGNTRLGGASRQYVGRSQLDAASIDRFAFMEFTYDEKLERALASDLSWCEFVQAVRKVVASRGLNHLVTPRATLDGCKLLASGFDWDTVAEMVVYKGLEADTVTQIKTGVSSFTPPAQVLAA